MSWDGSTFRNGTTADFDQLQAEALENLRKSRSFFVLTLDSIGGQHSVSCCQARDVVGMIESVRSAVEFLLPGEGV